jgi:hypothetical protein
MAMNFLADREDPKMKDEPRRVLRHGSMETAYPAQSPAATQSQRNRL